jgi:iron complex transport system substrate-binding protein
MTASLVTTGQLLIARVRCHRGDDVHTGWRQIMINRVILSIFAGRLPAWRVFLLAAICLLPGTGHAEISVIDDAGQTLVLEQPARRIISLAPHVTELLFAAGAGALVVGVSEYSDFPDQALGIPRIGGGGGLDVEAIIALQPDLVVGWQSGNPAMQLQRLRSLGLPVFVSEPRRIADIPATMQKLARLAGTGQAAQPEIDAFKQRFTSLQQAHANSETVSVYYQIWERPLMTVNGNHLISAIIRLCGGRNVFAELPELAPQIGIEAVLARDPQVIVVAGQPAQQDTVLAPWRRWSQLQAVRNRYLYVLERDVLVRHSPRILDGAERLCAMLDAAREGGL